MRMARTEHREFDCYRSMWRPLTRPIDSQSICADWMVGFPFHFLFSPLLFFLPTSMCVCASVCLWMYACSRLSFSVVCSLLFFSACKKFVERVGVFSALLFDAYVDPAVPFLQLPNICALLKYQTQVRMRINACIIYPSSISCGEAFFAHLRSFRFLIMFLHSQYSMNWVCVGSGLVCVQRRISYWFFILINMNQLWMWFKCSAH